MVLEDYCGPTPSITRKVRSMLSSCKVTDIDPSGRFVKRGGVLLYKYYVLNGTDYIAGGTTAEEALAKAARVLEARVTYIPPSSSAPPKPKPQPGDKKGRYTILAAESSSELGRLLGAARSSSE